jgi:hypothetical protein
MMFIIIIIINAAMTSRRNMDGAGHDDDIDRGVCRLFLTNKEPAVGPLSLLDDSSSLKKTLIVFLSVLWPRADCYYCC